LGAGLDGVTVAHDDGRAVGDLVAFAFTAVVVIDDDLARARHRNAVALGVGQIAQAQGKAHGTGGLGLDRAGHGRTRGGTADVERPHRQLRTRFADGLGSDDTDRLALADQRAAAQVAPIAVRAQTMTGFAGERSADLDLVHTHFV